MKPTPTATQTTVDLAKSGVDLAPGAKVDATALPAGKVDAAVPPGTKVEAQPTAAKVDASATDLYKSTLLKLNPDGSAVAAVKPKETLADIAKEALKENKPDNYTPSAADLKKAETEILQANHLTSAAQVKQGRSDHNSQRSNHKSSRGS